MVNFPFASTTFTQKRTRQTMVDATGNTVAAPDAVITTSLSMMLRDLNGAERAEVSGLTLQGLYRGWCPATTDIRELDELHDNNNFQRDGITPIKFQVTQVTNLGLVKKVHLHRTDIT